MQTSWSWKDFRCRLAAICRLRTGWETLAKLMLWEQIEEIYTQSMSRETGCTALSARIAFGAIFIKGSEKLTDEGTVTAIQENPCMQYFLGLEEFQTEALFAPSMMVHFRKQFPVGQVAKINEFICTGMAGRDAPCRLG